MKVLLEAGGNVNQVPNHGATPLHMASQENYPEIVQEFLSIPNINPHMYGTVSVGAHVAQSLGLLIQKVRREFPKCWSVNCEREYELLISVATDEHGFNNQATSRRIFLLETTHTNR